jgi:hypothetical protein
MAKACIIAWSPLVLRHNTTVISQCGQQTLDLLSLYLEKLSVTGRLSAGVEHIAQGALLSACDAQTELRLDCDPTSSISAVEAR